MSKMIEAACSGGIVTASGLPVTVASVLSEGIGASTGILILDEDQAKYLAKTSPDLKATLEKLSTHLSTVSGTLNTIANVLTSIGAAMTGPTTAPPPTLATSVATIVSDATNLTALKVEVDLLKVSLR
jgi:hypothetical protein